MNNTFLLFQSSKPQNHRENRPQRRSKNISRGIKMGIGPIWGINSVSPFNLSCFKISKIVFYKSLSFGLITYHIMFLTGNIWRRSGQQLHWWHSNWRLLFESRVMFLWWLWFNFHNLKFCSVKCDLFYSFYTPPSKFFCGLGSFRCCYLLASRTAKSQRSHLHDQASSSALTVSAKRTLW